MILLIQALCVALLLLTLAFWIETGFIFGPLAIIAFGLAAVWNLFFVIPYLVPIYALSAYSAECANIHILNHCNETESGSQYDKIFPNDDSSDEFEDTFSEHSLYLPPESMAEPFLKNDV